MAIEIGWIASWPASCFHATAAVLRGLTAADQPLAEALAEPAERFARRAGDFDLPPDKLLGHIIPLSPGNLADKEILGNAQAKIVGFPATGDLAISLLSQSLAELKRVFTEQRPGLVEELELRGPVLRQQWDARGPGLMKAIGRMTDEDFIAGRTNVLLVHPITGGFGKAYFMYNVATIEAVLANPHDELPEVLRLAWLLGQMNLNIPVWGEGINRHRLPLVGALALLPPTIAAAEQVELAQFSPETIAQAIAAWYIDVADPQQAADIVAGWWRTYQAARPKWPVALATLDHVLRESLPQK